MHVEIRYQDETLQAGTYYWRGENEPRLVTRARPAATVNGIPWTVDQTAQALRDANLCRCSDCACCLIRAAARGLQPEGEREYRANAVH